MGGKKLLGTAAFLGIATLLSRVLALLRDMAMAWVLGAGPVADCLVAALRLPHAVRRLLSEGSLSMTLTAWFAQVPGSQLKRVSRNLFCRLALILFVALSLLCWQSPWLAQILLPGFDAQGHDLTIDLLRLTLPYVFWAGLAALSMALLHSHGIFGPSALSPIVFNLVILLFILAAACLPLPPAYILAFGMTCGGIAQWYVLWRGLHHRRSMVLQGMATGHSSVSLHQIPAGLVGASAPQLVLLAAMGLASTGQGMVTALYYAERLLELPLGLIGVCLGMASLPSLSRRVAENNMGAFVSTVHTALRWSAWLGLAACAGLWAVGDLIVSLLFEHGNFATDATRQTWHALALYAPAIPACAAGRILLGACNALGLVKQTALTAAVSLLVTSLFGVAGLAPALAGCIGLWVQPLCLFGLVRSKLRAHGMNMCLSYLWPLRGSLAALVAGVVAWWIRNYQDGTPLALLLAVGAGGLAWLAVVMVCKGLTCVEK